MPRPPCWQLSMAGPGWAGRGGESHEQLPEFVLGWRRASAGPGGGEASHGRQFLPTANCLASHRFEGAAADRPPVRSMRATKEDIL